MKLVTYQVHGEATQRLGALDPSLSYVVDLSAQFADMLALIDGGEAALASARRLLADAERSHSLAKVTLLAPLPEPRQMRDAMTFELHYQQSIDAFAALRVGRPLARVAKALGIARVPRVWYQQPTYYKCNRFSVVGPDRDVIWPRGETRMDFECEIAVVIGKTGKDIAREHALEHVFGYTIFNDMTARDAQGRELAGNLGPAKGKDFDTGNVLGPWIVTRDELTDPYALTMVSRVDGEEWGRGHSGSMHHRWEDVIAHVSRDETLYAGEVIGSGTVGNGCGLERGRFLRAGSVIELEVSGLGTLRNRLVQP
jgi:2-keto-4-pentenoate hydratase/2-oxohepta-3-ene-1,7-dioic acid hydratase in catechol pathway